MTGRQRHGFVLLIIAGLLAASVVVISAKKTFLGLDLKGGIELVYQGEPTAQSQVTPAALARAVSIMRSRVDQLGVSEPSISTTGGKDITVDLPDVKNATQAENEVGQTATLYFYDWEATALTPTGQTVASQLIAQNTAADEISQGSGNSPGSPGEGSTDLYSAIKLGEMVKNPPVGTFNSHKYAQYYLFAAPGSAACTAAAKANNYVPVTGVHCYVAGPETGPGALTYLYQNLPAGVTKANTELMTIPRGIAVVAAVPSSFSNAPKLYAPTTQYYTLLDHVSLFGKDLTNPEQSTDSESQPDVSFGFTSLGNTEFENVTGVIAKRGLVDSVGGTKLIQHFAVALDNQLITVPQIDYTQYPDGIVGGGGAEIDGNFTIASAQALANELRLGALPIGLKRISDEQISASLGKQALHQGLIAGLVGLLIVALFLLAYYRLLGAIATTCLVIYAVYFYALIKLIPVTLTLAGIAGLILTIGVAADANIVIFERVKEEVRAGRSIRQSIVTGYKKGLTAIIDANVVTIMTAFILFILATSDVKGFAFTLGIGTLVSLFTAVLATQAILLTMGDSRTLARPSALGASGKKRQWKIDFMGRSKFFFSLSGTILLVGALAIGGRGLNLGIDFTSGTQISAGLVHSATQQQVTNAVKSVGVKNATVVRVSGDSALGSNGFQIESNKVPDRAAVQAVLQQRFGIKQGTSGADFSFDSVGPTFGSDVAHSAIVAIIISLLVITLYIALRFEWKFAVPVLIALMHDLLITAGVYALTGRTVTADTVAALLTILGYSLYDTIIVFDRVRENIPRMPRAAFSQIVNRSMAEVLTRSLATTTCTLLPVVALLFFGGSTLKDFAFALLIGVASGAYSSIFIASPVLTHWKERETLYWSRRRRITDDLGAVPAYAGGGSDVEPKTKPSASRGRITAPSPDGDTVSAAEFAQMKRDLEIESTPKSGRTSRLTRAMAQHDAEDEAPAASSAASRRRSATAPASTRPAAAEPAAATPAARKSAAEVEASDDGEHHSAPDAAENEGMLPQAPKPKRPAKTRNNRRHGRR